MQKLGKKALARDWLTLKALFRHGVSVTLEEIDYFEKNPDEIDEITTPVHVHKMFLGIGIVLGFLLVFISKIMKFVDGPTVQPGFFEEFVEDITFETGVALIGAGVTAYMLGILLNNQQENAQEWRRMIREKIAESEPPGS